MEAYGYGPGRTSGLRPLSVGETLDMAIKLYRSHALALWQAVTVVVVPLELIQLVVRRSTLPSGSFIHDGTIYTTGSGTGAVPLLVVVVIAVLVPLLSTGAVFKLLLDGYLGRAASVGETLAFASSRLLSLLWLSIETFVLVAIGFVLVIVPGIYLAVATSVAVPAMMMEGVTGLRAIERSRALVRGRWGATWARLIVAGLLTGILTLILNAINVASAFSVSNLTVYLAINAVVSALIAIFTAPFSAAVATVIYIDLRVRKEALDLELLAGGDPSGGGGGGGEHYHEPEPRPRRETLGGWPYNQPSPYGSPPADPNTGTSVPPPGG